MQLYAGEHYPTLHVEADTDGLWTVPDSLVRALNTANAELSRAEEAILAYLHTTGQTPPWPFEGYITGQDAPSQDTAVTVAYVPMPNLGNGDRVTLVVTAGVSTHVVEGEVTDPGATAVLPLVTSDTATRVLGLVSPDDGRV